MSASIDLLMCSEMLKLPQQTRVSASAGTVLGGVELIFRW